MVQSLPVAKAAQESGVAQEPIEDFQAYRDQLEAQLGGAKGFIRSAINRVHGSSKLNGNVRIAFPDAMSERVLKAAQEIIEENIATPILIGYPDIIKEKIKELDLKNLDDVEIIHPSRSENYDDYVAEFYNSRKRKGVTMNEATRLMSDPYYYASMAVNRGDADAIITGASQNYKDAVKPVLKTIGAAKSGVVAGLTILLIDNRVLFLADTTLNINPNKEQLAEIAVYATEVAQYFDYKPHIAMLSYSSFTAAGENPKKMKQAAEIVKNRFPDLEVDGEMQADVAISSAIRDRIFPVSELTKEANILVFPNLDSGNIAYKLLQTLGKAIVIGPFLMGVRRPAHVLQRTCKVEEIVNTAALTALQVHALKNQKQKMQLQN